MTNQFIRLLLAAILLASCGGKKNYKYIEINAEEKLFGRTENISEEPKKIRAISDSAAYLEAYDRFCGSAKISKDMKESLGKSYSTPIDFELLNNSGINIAKTVSFANKEKLEKDIFDKVFSAPNTIEEIVSEGKKEELEKFKATANIDSAKVKELDKYFTQRKDEFSNDSVIWFTPKTAPEYTNRNGIYCYFQTLNGMPGNLRFRVQYHADDWLFFSRLQFSIDGKAFEYIPNNTETDSGNGGHIWEWFDQALTSDDQGLIYALSNAKDAKMKFIGKQYHKVKTITPEQIMSIKRCLDMYNALGGKY